MKTSIVGLEQEDGRLLAHIIFSGKPELRPKHRRFIGKISDVEKSTFTVENREGARPLVFTVDQGARFKSREGAVQGLEDLRVGMVCLVAAREVEDGSLLAGVVAVATSDQLPRFESRALGGVVSVPANSFTLKLRNGGLYNILISPSTMFRSPFEGIDQSEDLQSGMIVAVGGKELDTGTYRTLARLARVIRLP